MKRIFLMLLITVFAATSAFAAAEDVVEGMGKKVVRGAVDIVSAPVELPAQIIKGFQAGFEPIENTFFSKTIGTFLGIFRGVTHGAGRLGSGVKELVGFWAADPADNDGVGIPFDAEYAWEEGYQYSIFEPDFEEGVKPIGRKLARGLGNGLFGIVELPGQTLRGASESNVFKGVFKGFYYWLSREVHGLADLYTVFSPNHPDTLGNNFNGEWPWTVMSEEMEN